MDFEKKSKTDHKGSGESIIERAASVLEDDIFRNRGESESKPISTHPKDHEVEPRSLRQPVDFYSQTPGQPPQGQLADRAAEAPSAEHQAGPNGFLEVDDALLQKHHLLSPGLAKSRGVEEFRQIKRAILRRLYFDSASRATSNNLILVTSARPNEGKTFTAINLAISFASERDLSVLLVDVDQTNRGVRQCLGIPKSALGLNDLIEDPSLHLSDIILKTNIKGLSVLPAGTFNLLGTELMSSKKMASVLDELAEGRHGSIVIFDAPPVLATADAAILSQRMGQIVFVIEADKTSHTVIEDALEIIGDGSKIGFVLNKTRVVVGDSHFGAYYSYGYDKPSRA